MSFGPMGNVGKMLKQLEKVQQEMARLQEELARREVEATAGGGMVKAVVNGQQELVRLEIAREAVDPDDVELLQDMIVAAVNEANRKAQELVQAEMARVTGGLKWPKLPGFPGR
ncbi:YbaB/EbfC family nucleoid-associated protein [Thermaerobacter sp. FW80]|uniref:Nucleoid-associated protein Q5761_00105 n=2 Tax=Clostridiales Family XVII. Incertae Sedis TaxID=539000 RepID=A0ABZ0QQU7_9FIRM|nr:MULTISPECIES: YbaB/EbfC family nucleoid-associated protein [Thermaerobacter]PZN07221.1 MAG: YbaB/EbfC family nucleoid-associated protein [Bacillota bacterium]QBS37124.1 YbaB/EbfC family nucleoid-associated protein [Thermaerobacter sp. FW80]WPD19127.1 YbaB/EbfC family nucleoid-associated protein [Thermaerobacter composti]